MINEELSLHPKTQLLDVFKLCYQSVFGPAHIISDPKSAKEYLKKELSETEIFAPEIYQNLSCYNDYYRVNLLLVKNGSINFDIFFDLFMASAVPEKKYTWTDWERIWAAVDIYLDEKNISFSNEKADREMINEIMEKQIKLFSHSEYYHKKYKPHYRLMKRRLLIKIGVL
jgi:hypothetical protein